MSPKATRDALQRIVVHCEMYLLSQQRSAEEAVDEIVGEGTRGRLREFGALHLIAMMFLIDKADSPMGGFVYRILKSLGHSDLAEPFVAIFETPIGETTFGDLLRQVRNRLATHGELTEEALPAAIRRIRASQEEYPRVEKLTEKLRDEVAVLKRTIEELPEMKQAVRE